MAAFLSGRFFVITASVIALLCLLPHVAVLLAAFSGSFYTLEQLSNTVLGRYASATLILVVCVAFGTACLGAGAAWLVTMTDFPGRRLC